MKKLINHILLFAVASVALWSCKKDEDRAIFKPAGASALQVSSTDIVLNSANALDTAITFNWTAPDYGFDAAVRYTLQLARTGTNFASAKEYVLTGLQKKITTAELNQAVILMGLAPAQQGSIDARLISSLGTHTPNDTSEVTTIKVTPYLVIINYPSLWLPGDYQGWKPEEAPKISSVRDNGEYEGYVYFSKASPFKFTSDPDWNHTNYGDGGAGKLSTSGGDIMMPAAGYYLIKANTKTLTWSALKTSWGLVGSATGSWDNDKDMVFDEATKTWSITTNLTQGEIKFRANDGWDLNYGDDNADKSLEPGGANVQIASDGNYTVTLDLSVPGNYTYVVKKN